VITLDLFIIVQWICETKMLRIKLTNLIMLIRLLKAGQKCNLTHGRIKALSEE